MIMPIERIFACDDAMERLWEYLDEELPDAVAEGVERHLAECRECGPRAAFDGRFLDRIASLDLERGDLSALRSRIVDALHLRAPTTPRKRCPIRYFLC